MSYVRSSESIEGLAAALALAQAEFKPAALNCVNPHFKNRYADLSSIIEATRASLSKHGLSFIQCPVVVDGRLLTVSRLMHKSGQWLESDLSLKPGQDAPQAYGSAITYGRRYGLGALLGISTDDDDDGAAAQPQNKGNAQELAKKELELKAARTDFETVRTAFKMLERNVLMMVRFEELGVTHAQLAQFCGKGVADWAGDEIKKLNEVGKALKEGADWSTLMELSSGK